MIKNNGQDIYILKHKALDSIVGFQREEFERNFEKTSENDLIIQFYHKGYTCNDKFNLVKDSKIHAISMFSGAGGLDIGAQLAGVKVITSLDVYEDSVDTLKANKFFNHCEHFCEDIKEVKGEQFIKIADKEKYDKLIVIGGPPCQPFSKAGYWVTNENRNSKEDPRNMIPDYFRLISEIMPDGIVLENVESILHPSNKETVELITSSFAKLGYNYSLLKVNAADYGIPQKRKRVFFLASKKPINAILKQTHGSDKDRLLNPDLLPYERVIDWIGKFDNEKFLGEDVLVSGKYEEELKSVPPGKNYISLTEKAGHPNPKFVASKRYWSSLLKLNPELPSWTIIASPGHWEGPFHWNNRRLSIREAAAIQTFPDDYVFKGSVRSQRKQIGNAVPPLLAKLVVKELCRWI